MLELSKNVVNVPKIKPNVKNCGYLDLCGKIVANFQKTFLKPRNVCKCMLVEVMAHPN